MSTFLGVTMLRTVTLPPAMDYMYGYPFFKVLAKEKVAGCKAIGIDVHSEAKEQKTHIRDKT